MDVDLQLFKNIMAEGRNNTDLLDSYSPNQFKSKEKLIKLLKDQLILNTNFEIVILGCWYGSILIPSLKHSKRITAIDINPTTISIAKNRLFSHYENVDWITSDVFDENRYGRIKNANLIINTSCENMKSMKHLSALKESKAIFAFQSNNMYEIHDSVNCVKSIDEFKKQLPDNAKVIVEDTIADDRGARFTLIGQL
tara:strand:+ start:131 stop:721 length:591 start_codon:yes stop_codon:yes gene_type:complete